MDTVVVFPECDWCHTPCDEPERTVTCDCPVHEGETATYCKKSCKAAHHG